MPTRSVIAFLLVVAWSLSFADSNGGRLTPEPVSMSEREKQLVGEAICGANGFETTETGVRCHTCPKFTGNAGSPEGLEIGYVIRGQFTGRKAQDQWLLDTDGCEAHFESFGGAILMGSVVAKPAAGTPAVVLGSSLATKQMAGAPRLLFYRPGFRVNDCLVFDGDKNRTLLVCNEADMAQGEVIGHISAMEITKRGITRWRLLRWYDNAGTDLEVVLSVVPTAMRRVTLDDGKTGLLIKITKFETTREAYGKGSKPKGNQIDLLFHRKGPRLFATEKTQKHLEEISALTRRMLE